MANNPYVNKVVYGNTTVMDISDTNATESDVVSGKTFYKGSGERATGSAVIPDISNCYQTTDTAETDLADVDYIPFYDSSASGKRKSLWSNIKAKLKTYFDGIYTTDTITNEIVKDTVGWTGKNLLPNNGVSQTINGVTFTVNSDGSVTANGTASANVTFKVAEYMPQKGNYIASKGFNSDASHHCGLLVEGYNGSIWVKVLAQSYGTDEQSFNVDYVGYDRIRVTLKIDGSDVINSLNIYPMIRHADIADSTYEPYHIPLKDSKADADALDGWMTAATVDSSGNVTFTGLDDTKGYAYEPYFNITSSSTNMNPTAEVTTLTGTGTSSMSVTYTTDADIGTSVKLRIIK